MYKIKYVYIYMSIVITFGTFDLLHIGHINILKKCKTYGDKLIEIQNYF